MKFNPFDRQRRWWFSLFAVAVASAASVGVIYRFLPFYTSDRTSVSTPPESAVENNYVAALGYLEPQGEVIRLSAPASAYGARVDQILVKLGDRVEAGQVVAILDSRDRLEAALKRSEKQVSVAQARLEQVKAGAKQGDINAQQARIENLRAELRGQKAVQKATIDRLEAELEGEKNAQEASIERLKAELRNAKIECGRYQMLYKEGAIAAQEYDRKCLEEETAQKRVTEAESNLSRILATRQEQIVEAKANLNRTVETLQEQVVEGKATLERIAEVRPVDVEVAQAELEDAKSAVEQSRSELDLAYVRSPRDGQILKIHTRSGEIVSEKGIVELGETEQMYVKAEVYETDISKVRPGQLATMTGAGLTKKLQGTVEEIGLQIGKKDILGTDPTAYIDAKVVEVRIRLAPADSKQVAGLTNLEMRVIIDPSIPPKSATNADSLHDKPAGQ